MASEINYGWVCPKCGCPNAPTNKSCVACFNMEHIEIPPYTLPTITPFNPLNAKDNVLRPTNCTQCGIRLDTVMGYCCPNIDCPSGMGPIGGDV